MRDTALDENHGQARVARGRRNVVEFRSTVEVGDIVLVGGNERHVFGRVDASYVYGICTAVDRVPRPGSAEKVLPPGA